MKAVLLAAVISLVGALFGTPMYIKFLVRRGYGQFIRDDGPTSHHTKRGTPTMGGAVIIGSSIAAYGLAHAITGTPLTWSGVLVLFLMTGLEHAYVSSSLVREIAAFGGDVSGLVPKAVLGHLGGGRRPDG